MKKILMSVSLLLLSLVLISCTDRKMDDNSINVLFYTNTNGVTNVPSLKNLEANQLIEEPEEPKKLGSRFMGWFKDAALTELWDFQTDKIGTKSIVLYAGWGEGIFSIVYELNGGTMPSTFIPLEDYPEEERDPELNPSIVDTPHFYRAGKQLVFARPTRTGYTFANWYLYDEFMWPGAPEGTLQSYRPGDGGYNSLQTSFAEDLILYAHWNAIKMSVTFRANYPGTETISNPSSRTLTYGFEFIYDRNYTNETGVNRLPDFRNLSGGLNYEDLEYEFIGWNDQVDGSGTWFGDGTGTPGESTTLSLEFLSTLYAQWQLKDA